MTTINPMRPFDTSAVVVKSDINDSWTYVGAAGHYKTADILAALGIPPKMPEQPPLADWERDLLGSQNDDGRYWHGRAMENLRKAELATTRAENAEAEALERAKLVRTWADRAEKAEEGFGEMKDAYRMLGASHALLLSERDEQRARAEKAEATLSRIEDVRRDFYEIRGDWADPEGAAALKVQMERAILGDPPFEPFELPTEAGTIVLAKGSGNRQDYELHRTTKGRWFTPGLRQQWTDAEMLAEFTDHRLLGADQ